MGAKYFAKKEANRRTDKRNRVKEVQKKEGKIIVTLKKLSR